MKVVKFQQKRIFLNCCVKQNVLLRSQLKKGVDYDLLLTQQARNISNSLKELNKFISVNQSKIIQYLSNIEKKSLKKIERSYRYKYIKKFNWIHDKQVHFILKNKLTTRKKIKNKKDTTRYKRRKRDKNLNKNQRMAEDTIMNKSDYDIKLEHKLLLLKELNFVPTPNWSGRTEDEEYLNFLAHIRRVEWDSVITENEDQFQTDKIPSKLQIKQFNRPDKDLVDAKTRAYVNSVHSKLKTIKVSSKNSHRNNNKLNFNQRMALD